VYEEGWQSWSPAGVHRADGTSARPAGAVRHTMGWRPGKSLPGRGFQGEGLLAVAPVDGPARVWFAPDPGREVASIRLDGRGRTLVVSADGPVRALACDDGLGAALARAGDELAPGPLRSLPPGWCSWSYYFGTVTERDVAENVEAARDLALPVGIVQLDDGYEAGIGDWLEARPGFGSIPGTAARVADAGLTPGIWTAPFLVGEASALAAAHADWLVAGADAGWNWKQRLRALDVTHPDAAAWLEGVFRTLREWGFGYFKLDFLYAGALAGARCADCSALDAYREGLRIVRRGAGPDSILLGCGAPLLPSIGVVDAMRVGPDVLPESPGGLPPDASAPALRNALAVTAARSWMHARLWTNDPDCLVVRPEIAEREAWAAHLERYRGLAFSSDRLAALDERGLELTRRLLRPSSTEPLSSRI
jgi:alpha-galactosidase